MASQQQKPTLQSHQTPGNVSVYLNNIYKPNTRLYKSTGQTAVGFYGDWALTYFLFHHAELNMWVIGEGEEALTSLSSEKILVRSGVSGSRVIPLAGFEQWTWENILPYCMDMGGDNFCKYEGYKPDETSRTLTHKNYPFSENMDGKMVTQFTYKGETYMRSAKERTLREHSSMPPSLGLLHVH